MPNKTTNGFTLIELSIVIVIIGLIVAGVLGGNVLVQQAKLRILINEISEYKSALGAFKATYGYLPGDIPNAHDYWGNACDSDADKCNGNGNKIVAYGSQDGGGTNCTDDCEAYRAWQHLSLSGIISESYTGVSTLNSAGLGKDDGVFSKSGFGKIVIQTLRGGQIFQLQPPGTLSIFPHNNSFVIGGPEVGTSVHIPGASVAEAYSIDQKTDDGVANTGKWLAIDGNGVDPGECSAPGSTVGGANFNTNNLGNDTRYCFFTVFYDLM